jgi:hypothetical protein
MQSPSANNVQTVTFPSHTLGTFQMLDVVLSSVLKRAKGRIQHNSAVPFMQKHAMRMLRVFETAATRSTVTAPFHRAGFLYQKNENGSYVLKFNEAYVRDSPEFREIWDINFSLQSLTARHQHSQWGSLNGFAIASEITAIFHLCLLKPLPFHSCEHFHSAMRERNPGTSLWSPSTFISAG